MISGEFAATILAIITLLGGSYCLYKVFHTYQLIKAVEDMPTSRNRSVAMGNVEIKGRVVPWQGRTVKSPVGRQDCVYCQVISNRNLVSQKMEEYSVTFVLEEGGSRILADLKGAEFIGKQPDSSMDKEMLTEHVIRPGDTIYILGNATALTQSQRHVHTMDVMIRKTSKRQTLLVSNRTEESLLKILRLKLKKYMLLCFTFFLICGYVTWYHETLGSGAFWRWYKTETQNLRR